MLTNTGRVNWLAISLLKKISKIFSTLKNAIEISIIPMKNTTQKHERIIYILRLCKIFESFLKDCYLYLKTK